MARSGTKNAGGGERRQAGDAIASGSSAGVAPRAASAPAAATAPGDRFLSDHAAVHAIEQRYPEGLTSAQIVEAFNQKGVHLSEATFRKWVQLGLLPRSRRVGRKGKHQGSLGLYPPSTVRRIAAIKRHMAENLTTADIVRSLRFRDEIEALERGLHDLLAGFAEELRASATATEGERRQAERLLEQLNKQSGELVRRIGILERRIVEPLEREAKARAFGTGTSGGAGDLL